MKIIKIIITFCLLLTLNGCGLHLRGMGSADSDKIHYKSVQIVGNRNSTLYQMLYTKINAIGVKIVDKPADDTLILIIGATNFTQKTVSVDSRSQDVEYSLSAKTIYYFGHQAAEETVRLYPFTSEQDGTGSCIIPRI